MKGECWSSVVRSVGVPVAVSVIGTLFFYYSDLTLRPDLPL